MVVIILPGESSGIIHRDKADDENRNQKQADENGYGAGFIFTHGGV
jgi:hypothetical protein